VVQAWTLFVAPRRFMEEWSTGRRTAMDPLAFLAAGVALKALVARYGERYFGTQMPSSSVVDWMRSSTGVTAVLFAVGGVSHLVLRRRSRAPLRSTVAAIAYTSGGPAVILACIGWVVALLLRLGHRDPTFMLYQTKLTVPVVAMAYVSHAWTLAALAGAHRVRWVWAALAVLATVALPFVLVGTGMLIKAYAEGM
jgi:hypothetical protein